ncbi:helix-turn-helix transcriptional regulator [Leucobacter japonicus]|uniref:helix-turn-helix transcriptional regulator n=1 Tax=Leucobacter japonicus TaxID=1461259 RepID=UPI0006A7A81A|nr:WYL domain-containing protein [Leucobacter japonicus]
MAGGSSGTTAGADRGASAQRSRVPSEQRLFSLVLALVVSPNGSTKRELLSSVYGYADRYSHGDISASLEKQFERDKEQLRELGIAIETFDDPSEIGNNQLTRYRIAKDLLQFPADLRFSERELMLLRLAALAWSEGSLSAESRRAAMKLEALGAGLDVQHLGIAPRLGSVEPSAAPLQSAIDAGLVVTFAYRMPDRDTALERRVAPLRLHRAEGRWHLVSWDLDRASPRTFLLGRIEGTVHVLEERIPDDLAPVVDIAIADLERLRSERRAMLRVRRGSIAEARLTSRGTPGIRREALADAESGTTDVELGVLDTHLLADELIGFGPDVTVCDPPELRALVIAGLRRIAAAHGRGAGLDPSSAEPHEGGHRA